MCRWEHEIDPHLCQVFRQGAGQDFAQRHGSGANLHPDHFKLSRKVLGLFLDGRILDCLKEALVLGDRGDHGHQVALTGAVVSNDQGTTGIRISIERKIGEEKLF